MSRAARIEPSASMITALAPPTRRVAQPSARCASVGRSGL